MKDYPKTSLNGQRKRNHIIKAELALGTPLPPKAEVHHFDGNKSNDNNNNLVICENHKYHRLLHARKRVLDYGGNPEKQKICCTCKNLKNIIGDFGVDNSTYDKCARQCYICRNK